MENKETIRYLFNPPNYSRNHEFKCSFKNSALKNRDWSYGHTCTCTESSVHVYLNTLFIKENQ